ncbi:MAG: hypothetical protein RL490_912 [Pseudomonadota bacterium]
MRGWHLLAAILAVVLGPPLSAAPPIDAYGQLPSLGDIALSPDGTRYAAIFGGTKGSEIQVHEIVSGKLLLASPAQDYKLRSLQWADNDRIVLTVSQTSEVRNLVYNAVGRGEFFQLLMHDLSTHKWQRLLDKMPLAANFVTGSPSVRVIDGRRQLIAQGLSITSSGYNSTLFRIDPVTGSTIVIQKGGKDTIGWIIGTDGRPVARSDYYQDAGNWRLLVRHGEDFKEIYSEKALLDRPALYGLGRTPGTLMVVSKKSGAYELYEVSLADGTWSPPLGDAYDGGIFRDPATLTPIDVVKQGLGTVDYSFFDADDQKLWRAIVRSFKGELVTLVDWSDDRNIVVANVFGPTSGDAIYVIDRKARDAGLLSPRYARIGPADIGPVQTLTYKAADGTDVPAYLTLPPGRTPKNLPLIAFPHGGPEANDSPGFEWWAQAMTSRGYAVLQPQFRGSTGFGDAHRTAGYGQWGRKMQTDVSDGVRHLAGLGTIDPKRVCIVGASYGGYAALAGVTVEQGVYRCASAIAGVSDLRRMLTSEANDAGGTKRAVVRYWQRFMGARDIDDTSIDAWSPARLASKVSVPLQLIHGKDDLVVPIEQSNFMVSAMKAAGKPVEMVVLPGEDHWLSRPTTRIAMLEAVIAFLEKHNPPDAAAASAPAAPAR